MRLSRLIRLSLLPPLAVLLLWVGVAVPVHFRSVSPVVLEEAGKGSEQIGDRCTEYLNAGQTGPVLLLWHALGRAPGAEGARARYHAILERNPLYLASGGPAPYFEQFLKISRLDKEPLPERVEVIPLLVPVERRRALAGFLAGSSNADVERILATRDLSGYTFFLPATTSAGHPLEATILMTALLVQGGHFDSEVLRWMRTERDAALAGDLAALGELESFYVALFSLGRRMNWVQLTTLLGHIGDATTLRKAGALLHQDHIGMEKLYAALVMAPEARGVTDYLERAGIRGWDVLTFALEHGSGALAEMVEVDRAFYHPPSFLAGHAGLFKLPRDLFKGVTQRHPKLAFGAKFLLFLGAGYAVALFIAGLVRMRFHLKPPKGAERYIAFGHLMIAVAVSGLIWVAIEPELLHFESNAGGRLQIRMAALMPAVATALTEPSNAMIDQVTILVLLMFFVIQLLVFILCMIRIREVRRAPEHASMKIALLENEESLFDLGLYVGLGGTVGSLILVVLDIVQASLMAAYASTLFGILFTALVKVCVVRPYRRRLILEASAHGTPKSQG